MLLPLLLFLSPTSFLYSEDLRVEPHWPSSFLVSYNFRFLPPHSHLSSPTLHLLESNKVRFLHVGMSKGRIKQSRRMLSAQSSTQFRISTEDPLGEGAFSRVTRSLGTLLSSSLGRLKLSDCLPNLPSEDGCLIQDVTDSICVENIFSLVKQFPCGDKSGLAGLFDKVGFFGTTFHSIDLVFEATAAGYSANFSFTLLTHDLSNYLGVFSLRDFCGAADQPTVSLFLSNDYPRNDLLFFSLDDPAPFAEALEGLTRVEHVEISRLVRGFGLQRRRVDVVFSNPTEDAVEITYYDHFPYNVDVYFSSLGLEDSAGAVLGYNMTFTPKTASSPYTTRRINLTLRAKGLATVMVDVMPRLSHYTESMTLFNGEFRIPGGVGLVVSGGGVHHAGSNPITLKAVAHDPQTFTTNLFIIIFILSLSATGISRVAFHCRRGAAERRKVVIDRVIQNGVLLGVVAVAAFALQLF